MLPVIRIVSRKRVEISIHPVIELPIRAGGKACREDEFRGSADLRLRGHGDLEGTRQSGEGIDLKIANLAADGQILQYARDIAQDVLNEDPDLLSEPNRILNERLKTLFAKKVNWGMIS